jgi:uncharacterized protein
MRSFVILTIIAAGLSASQLPAQAPSAPASCPMRGTFAGALSLSLFEYDRTATLDVRDSLESSHFGVDVHRVSFVSPKGGRATGLVHVPHDSLRRTSAPLPGIVMLHGAPGDAASMGGMATPVARHGAIVFVLDAPFARRDKNNPLTFTPSDSVDQVQLVVDLQRAVDMLVARADVDAERLAFVGVSYGGAMGALFAGVERRIGAYALLVADGGPAAHFTQADGRRHPKLPHVSEAQWCRWFEAMEPIASTRLIGRASPARVLFLWGQRDQLVPPYLAAELYRAAGNPKEERWYDSGHGLPPAAYLDVIDWLARCIGVAPVPAEERAKFPVSAP